MQKNLQPRKPAAGLNAAIKQSTGQTKTKTMNTESTTTATETKGGYCKTVFNVEGQQIVNTYKCNQKPFSTADLWNIQRQKKSYSVGSVSQLA